eukprot:CAMPEP_0181356128 /NCGR_PEP_ID=MMETSP1106-20121128/4259_1 /TAXON_ID=81844 /ORGANISM="Mantoniella antarctica, Strain SL-175" /LENGTH=72 /DNA_ID=CAMNT_0023468897 /DNA_START=214 /DNA_END=432 /DNA_ORIENTATION=-
MLTRTTHVLCSVSRGTTRALRLRPVHFTGVAPAHERLGAVLVPLLRRGVAYHVLSKPAHLSAQRVGVVKGGD